MSVTFKKLDIEWFESRNACNLDALRFYLSGDSPEIEVTEKEIWRAHRAGVLSSNWLAKRILDGHDLEIYEREMKLAMDAYEARMAPILAGIIARARARGSNE